MGFRKRLHIAVIGSPSSGKSYLLYDMIHAFHNLGYVARDLPLTFPHSSFGSFFYDVINPMTGGMKGTERYACRPENHYGALLARKGTFFNNIVVDFLNIPGEAFKDHDTMDQFFVLRNLLERKGKSLFRLTVWETPAGHRKKLVIPEGFQLKAGQHLSETKSMNKNSYQTWNDISKELYDGAYREVGESKRVTGKYILNHVTELSTDSILLSIKDQWKKLTATADNRANYDDFESVGTFKYFYFFAYCQLATDLIICDRMTDNRHCGDLAEDVCRFMNKMGKNMPKVYLAFRGIDRFLKNNAHLTVTGDMSSRNNIYSEYYSEILLQVQDKSFKGTYVPLPMSVKSHIIQCCGTKSGGNGFWYLLNTATPKQPSWAYFFQRKFYGRKTISELQRESDYALPPHVYFTATPIDYNFSIYQHDDDITRFISIEPGGLKSFVRETCEDMSHHFCFGSLQLLMDILIQNNVVVCSEIIHSCSKELRYAHSKLIK